MRRPSSLCVRAAIALLCSCAPAPSGTPPALPTVSVAPRAEPGPAEALVPPSAERPASVVAVARGKFPVLSGWRRGTVTPDGWASLDELLPMAQGRLDAELRVDDALLDEMDPRAPTELVIVVVEGARSIVRSIPIRDRARTLQVLERARLETTRLGGGAVLAPLPGGGVCLVADAVGPARARMVCGDSPEVVRAAGPFATRTLPELDLPRASVAVRLWGEPLRRAAGPLLTGGSLLSTYVALRWLPRLSVWIPGEGEALVDLGAALLSDLDELTLRVDMDREERDLVLDARLIPGKSSPLARSAAALAAAAGPIPAEVQRVPADAHTVVFGARASGSALAAIAPALEAPFAAALASDPALAKALPELFVPQGPFVYAAGFGGPGGEAMVGRRRPESWAEHVRRVAVEFAGWHLFSVEEPAPRIAKLLAALHRADEGGGLRALYYAAFPGACRGLPAFKPRTAPLPGLPRGTVAYEMTLPPSFFDKCVTGERSPPQTKIVALIAAVPDGARTWIGLSLDRDLLVGKLQRVLATRGAPSAEGFVAGGRISEAGSRVWQSLAGIGAWRDGAGTLPLPFSIKVTGGAAARIEIAAKAPRWQ